MADDPNSEWVYVRLKEHGDDVPPGRVTRKAYEEIWKAKGHVIVDSAAAELLGSPATVMEMQGATSEPASAPEGGEATTTRKRG